MTLAYKFEAFEAFMVPHIVKVQNTTEELQRLFNILDVDGTKQITFENLREVARQAGTRY